MAEKKRIRWVDALKGLAMIMVVLGHCGENQYIFKGLYYVHLPIFILASGFWLDKKMGGAIYLLYVNIKLFN